MKLVETIARRMIELREAREMSLQTVADRAGLSKSHIWDLESGRSVNPTINTVVAISRALGCSVDYLTGMSSKSVDIHPEAMRIALEVDRLLRPGRVALSAETAKDAAPVQKGRG